MNFPSRPTGYDVAKYSPAGRSDCHLTVGFDLEQGHIPRFLVQLHYQASTGPVRWGAIARMDHNETPGEGHDVYREGLHVDIARRLQKTVHLDVPHGPLPVNCGHVVRGCVNYFQQEADYFIAVYEERRRPGRPPRWSPDGGESADTFIRPTLLYESMSREAPIEDIPDELRDCEDFVTDEELTDLLAEATNTTPEEIERGAAELEIAPPWESEIVGYGEHDGEHGFLPEPADE